MRREVEIRKYELPSFKVTAHGLRGYYLPKQTATLEVNANYLFGKPLTGGQVRILENDEEFARGVLNAGGVFRKSFRVKELAQGRDLFEDRHFIAFVTDATTNRTELVKFDVRISRQDLHIYQVKQEYRTDGRRIYVTTYSAAGDAVKADVFALMKGKVVARARSNRYGITRLELGEEKGEILIRARTADGREGSKTVDAWRSPREETWLSVERTICAPGEAIRGRIQAVRKDFTAQMMAWNSKGLMVFSQAVKVTGGVGAFTIPYAPEFGRELGLTAVLEGLDSVLTAAVVFPGEDELHVKAAPSQKEYAPGEKAHLEFAASSQVALGISIVDQSVMERAATDAAFGQRRGWMFERPQDREKIGGVSYGDLLTMDPRKIDADVELLAELLVPAPVIGDSHENVMSEAESAYRQAIETSPEPFGRDLDELYRDRLEYPKDLSGYLRAGGGRIVDPWLQSYDVRFTVNQADDVMELWSSGPDKVRGSDDDFLAWRITRKWFARFESLMEDSLAALEDYPATQAEFLRRFEQAGVHFAALRDPWYSPLRLKLVYERDRRSLLVMSAGPDRKFGTNDDFAVCRFSGTYFTASGKEDSSES